MLISEFKAKCIGALKKVRHSGEPLLVTLRGEPLAEVRAARTTPGGVRLGVQKGVMIEDAAVAVPPFADDWAEGDGREGMS
jgi:hypothetical protein